MSESQRPIAGINGPITIKVSNMPPMVLEKDEDGISHVFYMDNMPIPTVLAIPSDLITARCCAETEKGTQCKSTVWLGVGLLAGAGSYFCERYHTGKMRYNRQWTAKENRWRNQQFSSSEQLEWTLGKIQYYVSCQYHIYLFSSRNLVYQLCQEYLKCLRVTYCKTMVSSVLKRQDLMHQKVKALEKNSDCLICMKEDVNLFAFQCKHSMCNDCCNEWVLDKQTCPFCRDVIFKDEPFPKGSRYNLSTAN